MNGWPRRAHASHDFAFSGLIRLCQMRLLRSRGDQEKEAVTVLLSHCTGYADKCQGNPASCRRHYVREEVLEQQFTACSVSSSSMMRCSLGCASLHVSHADKRREQEEAIARLRTDTPGYSTASTQCTWTSSTAGWTRVFREEIRPMAHRAGSLPARNRQSSRCRQVLHGRRAADYRTSA